MMSKAIRILVMSTFLSGIPNSSTFASSDLSPLPFPSMNSRENYLKLLLLSFRKYAGEDQVLTDDDVRSNELRDIARRRDYMFTPVINADLDGDGQVTPSEWKTNLKSKRHIADGFDSWDTDKDGVITLLEAYAYAQSASTELVARSRESSHFINELMKFDLNQDGRLTARELENGGRRAFAAYDADGDGLISPTELKRLKRDSRITPGIRRLSAGCDFPRPGADDKVFVIGSYEAGRLSSVSVAGQDRETETSEIHIEDGKEPIYLVATSYTPMIWRLTGHTERISHFVSNAHRGVGVIGIDKDKATLTGLGLCTIRFDKNNINKATFDSLAAAIGKQVDGIFDSYTLPGLIIPSQAVAPKDWPPSRKGNASRKTEFQTGTLKAVDRKIMESFRRFSPGGVAFLDAASVIASGTAEDYQVLPQEAGLVQLMQDGAVTLERGYYVINKPIARFPAGLNGSHSVRFLLEDGVPMPAGSPGHSKVITRSELEEKIRPRPKEQKQ